MDRNNVAIWMKRLALFYLIGGFLSGIILGFQDPIVEVSNSVWDYDKEFFNWTRMWEVIITTSICSLLLNGFAEVISLLHRIAHQKSSTVQIEQKLDVIIQKMMQGGFANNESVPNGTGMVQRTVSSEENEIADQNTTRERQSTFCYQGSESETRQLLEYLSQMESCKEIAIYLNGILQEQEEYSELLHEIGNMQEMERQYGNMKKEALHIVEKFFGLK